MRLSIDEDNPQKITITITGRIQLSQDRRKLLFDRISNDLHGAILFRGTRCPSYGTTLQDFRENTDGTFGFSERLTDRLVAKLEQVARIGAAPLTQLSAEVVEGAMLETVEEGLSDILRAEVMRHIWWWRFRLWTGLALRGLNFLENLLIDILYPPDRADEIILFLEGLSQLVLNATVLFWRMVGTASIAPWRLVVGSLICS